MRREIYAYDNRKAAINGLREAKDRGATVILPAMKAQWNNGDWELHKVLNRNNDVWQLQGMHLTNFHVKGNIPPIIITTLQIQVR